MTCYCFHKHIQINNVTVHVLRFHSTHISSTAAAYLHTVQIIIHQFLITSPFYHYDAAGIKCHTVMKIKNSNMPTKP